MGVVDSRLKKSFKYSVSVLGLFVTFGLIGFSLDMSELGTVVSMVSVSRFKTIDPELLSVTTTDGIGEVTARQAFGDISGSKVVLSPKYRGSILPVMHVISMPRQSGFKLSDFVLVSVCSGLEKVGSGGQTV